MAGRLDPYSGPERGGRQVVPWLAPGRQHAAPPCGVAAHHKDVGCVCAPRPDIATGGPGPRFLTAAADYLSFRLGELVIPAMLSPSLAAALGLLNATGPR